jgi:hypothetical protein
MISVIPKPALSAQQIAVLHKLCGLGMVAIRGAAASQTSVRDVEIFGRNWQSERLWLRDLSRYYLLEASVPFYVKETDQFGLDTMLGAEALAKRLICAREIELEQQLSSDLENGFISERDAFVPHDEDWTRPSMHAVAAVRR